MGTDSLDELHWHDLRTCPPEQVLRHEGVDRPSKGEGYEVGFLNALYQVDPQTRTIQELHPRPGRRLTVEFRILLIRYLVSRYGGPLTGEDTTEKGLPGGVLFFQGPHALHLGPLLERFGRDPDGFEAAGRRLDGVPVAYGDRAIRLHPFPLIPVTYVLWQEDEEFQASISVLFDRSISRWFALDMVFTLVKVLTQRLLENGI
jgi:hypothetical protein